MNPTRNLHSADDFICFDRVDSFSEHAGIVTCDNGDRIALSVCAGNIIRLRLYRETKADRYGILCEDIRENKSGASFDAATGTLSLVCGDIRLVVQQQPMRLLLYRGERVLLQSITDEHFRGWSRLPAIGRDEHRYTASFALDSEERIYGLGEKFARLDKRGQLIHSLVTDALGVNTDLGYKNTPFAWSSAGWGLFVHTSATVSHGVGYGQWSHRSYTLVSDEPALDLFLISDESPAQIIRSYTSLTGATPEVPLWSYGVWVSRAYYRTADEILAAAQTLRDKDFPADVITFDGRAWQDTPTRFSFAFDPGRYQDPARVIARLHDQGFRVCAWEYPLISVANPAFETLAAKGCFLKTREGEPYRCDWDHDEKTSPFGTILTPLPVSGIIDFTNPEAYNWWRDQHARIFQLGVDVMKVDFGEQVPADAVAWNGDTGKELHSVYPMLYNRCVYEATKRFYGDDACIFGRAGWAGSQRYPLQWGGDPQSDWEGMAASLRGALCWGMSGAPFHATDVGGFYGSEQPTPALYLRWIEWQVFASHFRVHGIGAREPWCFGAEAETIARRYFKLRYRLIPYLAGVGRIAAKTGLPVMRAMALAFPEDRIASGFEHQFMCGDALLIAPVLSARNRVDVWLPEGRWHDVWSGRAYQGKQLVTYKEVALDFIPVFLRDGHVLPLGRIVENTDGILKEAPVAEVLAFGAITACPIAIGPPLTVAKGAVYYRAGDLLTMLDRLELQ